MIWEINYSECGRDMKNQAQTAVALLICFWQIPLVMCCAEPDDTDEEEACEHCRFGRSRDDINDIDGCGAYNGGAGVYVLYKDVGHLEREDIP